MSPSGACSVFFFPWRNFCYWRKSSPVISWPLSQRSRDSEATWTKMDSAMVLGTSWDLLSMRQQAVHPVSPWMFYLRSILGSGRSCKPVYFSGLSFWGIHERFSRGPKPCQNLPKLHLCTKSPKLPFHIIWYGACHNLSPSEATTIFNSCHRRFSLSTCRAGAKGDKSQGASS